jgi:hypothetical protein
MRLRKRDRDIEDFEVIPDGSLVRVPLNLADSFRVKNRQRFGELAALDADDRALLGHRPGYTQLTDAMVAKRQATRADYIRDLNSAWRMDKRKPSDDDDDDDDDRPDNDRSRERSTDARADARAAYDEMCSKLQSAWHTPSLAIRIPMGVRGRDAAEPDLGTRPEEMMRRHLRAEPDDDPQARRDAAWNDYKTRLSEAWKTNPQAAVAIEAHAKTEKWRHGA